MKSKFIICAFFYLIFSCAQKPQIELNQSSYYFYMFEHKKKTRWYTAAKDSSITLHAIFQKSRRGKDPAYLKFFDDELGFVSIPISDTLKLSNNSLVKISGKIKQTEKSLPYIRKPIYSVKFIPLKILDKKELSFLQEKINYFYRQLFPTIQKKITPKESRLKLKPKTFWEFFYNAKKKEIIAVSIQQDLMYQASIEIFIDVKSEKIKKIRAKEWFKGEV